MSAFAEIDPCVAECLGELFINDVSMNTPAWNVLDITPLWMPPASRGTNVLIPYVAGKRAFPMRVDQTDYSLPMVISGAVDKDGNPDPDGVIACLYRNLHYLRDNVYGPVDGTTVTWPASIFLPWGDLLEADVQVMAIVPSLHISEVTKATLELRFPAGEFTLIPAS